MVAATALFTAMLCRAALREFPCRVGRLLWICAPALLAALGVLDPTTLGALLKREAESGCDRVAGEPAEGFEGSAHDSLGRMRPPRGGVREP